MMKIRVLMVDDEEALCKGVKNILERHGYEVSYALNGREALGMLEKEEFPVAILDLRLPGMDGMAILEEIKRRKKRMAIIIITAHASVDSAVTTLQGGVMDYIQKPFEMSRLLAAVEKAAASVGFVADPLSQINRNIGHSIRQMREQRGYTITQLAELTHLSSSLISQIENAKNSASILSLYKISRALKTKMSDLVDF